MARYVTLIALFLLSLVPMRGATATYNYTFANPVCSATLTRGCISGFAVGTVSAASATAPAVFTQMAACPLPATTTGTVTGITCTFTGTAPLGPVVFAVVATYVDSTGAAGTSPLIAPPAPGTNETSVTVTPNSPGGLVVIFP